MYFSEPDSFPKYKSWCWALMGHGALSMSFGTISLKCFPQTDGCFHVPASVRSMGNRRSSVFSFLCLRVPFPTCAFPGNLVRCCSSEQVNRLLGVLCFQ